MVRVVQVLVKAVVNWTKKVVSGSMSVFSMAEERERERPLTTMERVVQVLVKAVVNWTKKVVSGIMSVFPMAEEVVKRLVVIRPEVLFGVLKCFIGGSGRIASVIIFILEIIII